MLGEAAGDLVPPNVMHQLTSDVQVRVGHNLFNIGLLRRVQSALGEAGIQVLVLKGPATAFDVYGELALRPFADLDLLIRVADVARARAVLQEKGFEAETALPNDRLLVQRQYHLPMYVSGGGGLVELHWAIAPRHLPLYPDPAGCFDQARTQRVLGVEYRTLSRAVSVVFHCVHATKHGWGRLEWTFCMAVWMQPNSPIAWEEVWQVATDWHAEHMVALGAYLATTLFGAPLPPQVTPLRGKIAEVGDDALRAMAAMHEAAALDHGLLLRVQWHTLQRTLDRWRFVKRLVVNPSEDDFDAISLPWYPAYFVVHPLRMVGKALKAGLRTALKVAR